MPFACVKNSVNTSLRVLILVREATGSHYWLKLSADLPIRLNMDPSSIALQGLQQADTHLASAASNIASFQASTPAGASVDTLDLSAAVVALLSAKNCY